MVVVVVVVVCGERGGVKGPLYLKLIRLVVLSRNQRTEESRSDSTGFAQGYAERRALETSSRFQRARRAENCSLTHPQGWGKTIVNKTGPGQKEKR